MCLFIFKRLWRLKMWHIDDSNMVVFCSSAWDCDAPSIHFESKSEAEKNAKELVVIKV